MEIMWVLNFLSNLDYRVTKQVLDFQKWSKNGRKVVEKWPKSGQNGLKVVK